MRAGRLLGEVDFPIDIGKANDSQSGKTFRQKLVYTLYGETPYIIAYRETLGLTQTSFANLIGTHAFTKEVW